MVAELLGAAKRDRTVTALKPLTLGGAFGATKRLVVEGARQAP